MPTIIVAATYFLNLFLNKNTYPPETLFDWKEYRWKINIGNPTKNLTPYYYTTLARVIFVLASFLNLVFIYPAGLLKLSKVLVSSMASIFIFISLFADTLMLSEGNDWVHVTNWVLAHDDWPKISMQDKSFRSLFCLINKEILLITKGKRPFDLFGFICISNIPFYVIFGILTSPLMLLGNWDPTYLLLQSCLPVANPKAEMYQIVVVHILNISFKLIGFLVTLLCSQCVAVVMRNFVLLTNGMAQCFLALLAKFSLMPASRESFLLYRNLYMCYLMVRKFADRIVGVYVAISMVTVVVGTRTSMQAFRMRDITMGTMGILLSVFTIVICLCIFSVGTYLLSTSEGALRDWIFTAKLVRRRYLWKCLTACRPMMLRLGGVRGVIDMKMKMEFLNAALSAVVNVVIVS